MRINWLIGLMGLCILCSGMKAQEKQHYNGLVFIKEKDIRIEENKLTIDVEINISGIPVGKTQSLVLSPIIYNVRDSLILPPVVLNGNNKNKMYRRQVVLSKGEKTDHSAYMILKNDPTELQVISYTYTIPYQPWMKNAGLVLLGTFRNYNNEPLRTYRNVLIEDLELKH